VPRRHQPTESSSDTSTARAAEPGRQHFRRQLADLEAGLAQDPGLTYRDWQPTRWQSLCLLRDTIARAAAECGHAIDTALELGCGSATLLGLLAMRGVKCVGVDQDPAALAFAEKAHELFGGPVTVDLRLGDFLSRDLPLEQADLVFSIGVIEHYSPEDQLRILARHAQLSSRWVMIAVPNMESPLFKTFLQAMAAAGTLYDDEHLPADVPALCRSLRFTIIAEDGCHVFLSKGSDNRFATAELMSFQREIRASLLRLSSRYEAFPNMDFVGLDINALTTAESALPANTRRRFGFLRWYLIDVKADD
jgi:SAM-dependent methyltransferase